MNSTSIVLPVAKTLCHRQGAKSAKVRKGFSLVLLRDSLALLALLVVEITLRNKK
jgi:hypothetical protein